jgi:hypothetical protein
MNDIIITDCIINNKELKLEDIIYNFRLGTTPEGVINLYFRTKDKYVDVGSCFVYNPNIVGECITITPIIYKDGKDLADINYSEYMKHKDYYYISFVVPIDGYTSHITSLKYEYTINYIPNSILYNYDILKPVELTWKYKQQ